MKTLTETIDIAREELLTSKTKTVSEKTQLSLMKKTFAFMFNGDHKEISNNCFDIITSCEKTHLNEITFSLLDRVSLSVEESLNS